MASKAFRQDMPPANGYGPFQFEKPRPKLKMSGYRKFAIYAGITTAGWITWLYQDKQRRMNMVEENDSRLALWPIIKAEQDRRFLLQLRENRDKENELAKKIPDWEVGTYYGQPIYHNIKKRFIAPSADEYNAYADESKKKTRWFSR